MSVMNDMLDENFELRQQLKEARARIALLEHDMKSGDYETLYAQAVQELSAHALPEGWAMVPIVPTDDILDELYAENDYDSYPGMVRCWEKALAVAPKFSVDSTS